MIHHLTIRVRDLDRAKSFYSTALAPLGYEVAMEFEGFAGLGAGRPDLWLGRYEQTQPVHVAFAADSEAAVRAFYDAALIAGGRDNGPPGPRPDYGPHYFGAFVLDPEGNNIEATVLRTPGSAKARRSARPKTKTGRRASKPIARSRKSPRKGKR